MIDLKVFCCACTKYKWILPDFIKLAQANLPLPIDIHVGDERWDIRMRGILEGYTCRDVIYLQEDFLITQADMNSIERAYKLHVDKNAIITKLGNNYEFQTAYYPAHINGHPVKWQTRFSQYLMSHQPVAIFNREFLLSTISEETYNASIHEIKVSDWLKGDNRKIFCVGEGHYPKNYSDILTFEHAIRKGKVLRDAKPYLTNIPEGIEFDDN